MNDIRIWKYYDISTLVLAFISLLVLVLFPTSLIIMLAVQTVYLMISKVIWIILIASLLLIGVSLFASKVTVELLEATKHVEEIAYKTVMWMITSVLIVINMAVTTWLILYFS
jgi:hypothetical protein